MHRELVLLYSFFAECVGSLAALVAMPKGPSFYLEDSMIDLCWKSGAHQVVQFHSVTMFQRSSCSIYVDYASLHRA